MLPRMPEAPVPVAPAAERARKRSGAGRITARGRIGRFDLLGDIAGRALERFREARRFIRIEPGARGRAAEIVLERAIAALEEADIIEIVLTENAADHIASLRREIRQATHRR